MFLDRPDELVHLLVVCHLARVFAERMARMQLGQLHIHDLAISHRARWRGRPQCLRYGWFFCLLRLDLVLSALEHFVSRCCLLFRYCLIRFRCTRLFPARSVFSAFDLWGAVQTFPVAIYRRIASFMKVVQSVGISWMSLAFFCLLILSLESNNLSCLLLAWAFASGATRSACPSCEEAGASRSPVLSLSALLPM